MADQDYAVSKARVPLIVIVWSIITSIIGSILYAIFQDPVVHFLRYLANSIASPLYNHFVDSEYREAALGPDVFATYVETDILFDFFLMASVTISLIGVGLLFFRESRRAGVTVQSSFVYKVLTLPNQLPDKFVRCFFVTSIPFFIISILSIQGAVEASLDAYSNFDIRFRALAAVMTDKEAKEIVAAWAMMKSKADNDKINSLMEEIATREHVTLPKRR